MTRAGRLPALGGLRIAAQKSPDCAASVRPPEIPCGFWARTGLGGLEPSAGVECGRWFRRAANRCTGRTPPLGLCPANGRLRRDLAVRDGTRESRQSIPAAAVLRIRAEVRFWVNLRKTAAELRRWSTFSGGNVEPRRSWIGHEQ